MLSSLFGRSHDGALPSLPSAERRRTIQLYDRLQASYTASPFGGMDQGKFAIQITTNLFKRYRVADDPAESVIDLFYDAVAEAVVKEGYFTFPELPRTHLTASEAVEFRDYLRMWSDRLKDPAATLATFESHVIDALGAILTRLPPSALTESTGEHIGEVPLIDMLEDAGEAIEWICNTTCDRTLEAYGLFLISRGNIRHNQREIAEIPYDSSRQVPSPSKLVEKHGARKVAKQLFADTPYADLFDHAFPFSINPESRFTHQHVLGGSGHGKTQGLQRFQMSDFQAVKQGTASLVVIDSQGDMLSNITHLAEFDPDHPESLADRLVLIDPNDIEHPPCLNLFDIGLDRLDTYSPVEREKLINGAIALYEYMFGALLGAGLTARQGVIFRYLARMLMVVPDATIHTLRHFMEQPETTRAYFGQLDHTSRSFFETQFLQPVFDDTRQQILTRLWGVLSNPVLERMFTNRKNKINLFEAINTGKIVLINTAKDLLKQDGCEILGRFFIALLSQSIQERAAITSQQRMDTFIYIDEVQDYFSEGDKNLEILFSQARKYRAALTIANQTLGQFPRDLLASVMASTAIKMVGGMSAKDAGRLAKEMRCEPELLLSMRKRERHTEFACYEKNVTAQPVRLVIPFGEMEKQPKLSDAAHAALLDLNRAKYCAGGDDVADVGATPAKPTGGFEVGEWGEL